MNFILIMICCIIVNLIINLFISTYLLKQIIRLLETYEKMDDLLEEHICKIYDIIKFNGLVKPNKKDN